MFIKFLQKYKWIRKIIYWGARARARELVNRILQHIDKNDLLVDIGSGTCNVSELLSEKGNKTIPLDVKDLSFVNNLQPVIYDGKTMPFNDEYFDKSLILTVLHHTPDPEQILTEAKRVSKSIIVIEDIYVNSFHKYITYFFDSLMNLGCHHHPHTNKSDDGWKKTFKDLGLKLVSVKYKYSFIVFKQATYYLEKE